MWTSERSITLSKICTLIFIAALIVVEVGGFWLVPFLLGAGRAGLVPVCLTVIYANALPCFFILFHLYKVLRRLEKGAVFVQENVSSLRIISWLCFVCAVICIGGAVIYFSWIFVAVAAAFIGLIVRVVRNVFARAVALQEEVDYTI